MITDNNSTQPQQSQDLTPEEAKASLGMATMLQDQFLQMQNPKAPQTPETAPDQTQTPEPQKDPVTEIEGLRTEIMKELQTMREDMKVALEPKDEKAQIFDLKKQIEEVLNSTE